MKKPTAIESFCGAGGMSLGLEQAGYDVRLAFDNTPVHIETYNTNLSANGHVMDASQVCGKHLLDLAGLKVGELDLFSGGPPCQGFSKQRKGASQLMDPRNRLVLEFARLVKETEAKAFLFENVQIFGQKRGAHLIEEMSNLLNDYKFYRFFVSASDFGAAQKRGRFLLIGIQDSHQHSQPELIEATVKKTVFDAIGDLPSPPDDYSEHPSLENHIKCKITKLNEERISYVPQGGGWQDIPWELRLRCHQVTDPKKGGWPDVYGRLSWDSISPTITAGFDSFSRGRYGHPVENRSITPREAARLQEFPDWFRFCGNRAEVRTQIGNAVPPTLAKAAGLSILHSLKLDSLSPTNSSFSEKIGAIA